MPKRRASLPNATEESSAKKANTKTEPQPVIDLTQKNIPAPTNIVPDYDPLQAINETEEKEEREEIENFRILDTLAWLLETNTSDCVALTVVESDSGNCRLLIATNSIHANPRKSNQSIAHMNEVLKTLSKFSSGKMTKEQEKEVIINIFERKLRSTYKGSLVNSLSTHTIASLKKLISTSYDNATNGEIPQIPTTANDQFTSSILQTSAAITLANRILRRFYRIKNQLNTNNNTPLKKALCNIDYNKDDQMNFLSFNEHGSAKIEDAIRLTQSENQASTGYGIVTTHTKDQKTVHAETKLLDYLMATRIITKTDKKDHDFGISKKLCPSCNDLFNQLETTIDGTISKPKAHNVHFENWGIPLFLQDEYTTNDKKPNPKTFGYLRVYEKDKEKESFIPFSSLKDYENKLEKFNSRKGVTAEGYLNRDHKLVEEMKHLFDQRKSFSEKNTDNGCISHSSPEKIKNTEKSPLSSEESIEELSSSIVSEVEEAMNNGVGKKELEKMVARRLTTSLTRRYCLFSKQSENPTTLTSPNKETIIGANFSTGASP